MKEYIDKNKAQIFLRTECLAKYPTSFANGLLAAADQLNKLPTADVVEVRHGEWKICSDGYYPYCSRCVYEPEISTRYSNNLTPYCPNCGAKMDGERKEQG